MIKIKKDGFTLSEALITLSVLGALALLVLPGLIKDSTNKASIALLQSTVSILNDTVQNEIMRTRATNIKDTNIYSNPSKFFEAIDTVKVKDSGSAVFLPAGKYKTINGGTSDTASSVTASAILRNGAGVAFLSEPDNKRTVVVIDINGNKEPNIIGVDCFDLILWWENDFKNYQHMGDLGGKRDETSISSLKASCKKGDGLSCYLALEASGFDHNYLN